jgi:Na+/H+-dicarboxylate symporter
MKLTRYIVGIIGFLLVWVVVAIIIGVIVALLFPPPPGDRFLVGVGMNWRNLPGTVLGLLAGIQSFRASTRAPKK